MRRKNIFGPLAAILVLVCASGGIWAAGGGQGMPEANGQAVLDYITKESPYAKWPLVPGTTAFRNGKEPHGALQNVYANPAAMAGFSAKSVPMPDGTLIVKENFTLDRKLQSVILLYKKAGYNPEAGDYFWMTLDADMKIQKEGRLAGCITCHTQAKYKDYLVLSPGE